MPDAYPDKPSLGDRLRQLLFISVWLPRYTRADLRGDVLGGLTVGVMLVPQGMAYAVLAGLPPIYGLYASLVPLLVYPLFGSSRHLAIGITAIDSLIIVAGVALLAEPGSGAYIELVLLLTLMVGAFQMLLGALRLGFVVNLLSRPVILGFTAAAALTIAASQLGNLLGITLPRTSFIFAVLWSALEQAADVHALTLLIGLLGVVLLLVLRRYAPRFPASLLAVALAAAAVWYFRLDEAGVRIVGTVPSGLPELSLPPIEAATLRELFPTAVTLALVQFMSVISLGKVFAAKYRYRIGPNRELFALGALNFFGGFFRSQPVSGSFSRSAVADEAGTRTALTNVFAALVVALTLLFLTPLFTYLPMPIFAAIILVAVASMVDVEALRFLYKAKKVDGWIALLTFGATLAIGITEGVLIGIGASVVAIMYRISYPNVAELGHLPGTRSFRDVRHHPEAEHIEGLVLLRVDASFSFANADFLQELLLKRSEGDGHAIRAVVIDASSINDLDTTAAEALVHVKETLAARGIDLYFGGVKDPVLRMMQRSGLAEKLGPGHLFLTPHRAVRYILEDWGTAHAYLETVPDRADEGDLTEGLEPREV